MSKADDLKPEGGAIVPPLFTRFLPGSGFGRGIALLAAALLIFTLMDAFAKELTERYHPGQIVWARFAVNFVVIVAIFRARAPRVFRSRRPGLQFLRALTQIATVTLYFLAIQQIGLAEAAALFDINPMLITLGAALFLGESLGPRRLVGIAIAFVGALIILRPGMGAFEPAGLYAICGAFVYAAGALLTRAVRTESTGTSMLWSAVVGLTITSLAVPLFWAPIATGDLWLFALVGVLGAAGQAFLIMAFAETEAGLLAPFGYLGLVFSAFWGALFFGQWPDGYTILGAAIITAAGVYVWWRERQATRRAS